MELVKCTQNILRRLIVSERYDSISNFLAFYEVFKGSDQPFREVFDQYAPVIHPHLNTCVGLGLELIRRWRCLEGTFPGLSAATALLSCEETAKNVCSDAEFTTGPFELPAPDKEHLVVGIQIILNGRNGLLIADAGYHVARIVTVMQDELSPHTGWFNLVTEPNFSRNYSYSFNKKNSNYVEWKEEEIRGGEKSYGEALIYAARGFCDGITIVEKRNLVYQLKSLINRSHSGVVTAGLFLFLTASFNVAKFQIIFQKDSQKVKKKFKFKDFQDISAIDAESLEEITICNRQMKLPDGKLLSIIESLVEITADESFVNHCLELNTYICELSI